MRGQEDRLALVARAGDDLPSVARLLALSDIVVAIARTLLVVQLKVPAAAQVADPLGRRPGRPARQAGR